MDWVWVQTFVIIVAAAAIQTGTGFGFAIIAIPLLLLLYDATMPFLSPIYCRGCLSSHCCRKQRAAKRPRLMRRRGTARKTMR